MRHVVIQDDRAADRPLTEPVLWILLSLSEQPRHGYALIKHVERLSDGRVRLSTGTLYGALRRMVEGAWIEAADLADTSRDKQAYRLTRSGRTRLREELDRLAHVTRTAALRLKLKAV
jgi:DNA-binding PadR family transcriptional regulator